LLRRRGQAWHESPSVQPLTVGRAFRAGH